MIKENSKVFLLILLGMLTAFGPFVTDMYLPSLPSMGVYFSTSSSMIQLGLTTSMIGLAVGQIFFGPLSDRYGRRLPLVSAMWLFNSLDAAVSVLTDHRVVRGVPSVAGHCRRGRHSDIAFGGHRQVFRPRAGEDACRDRSHKRSGACGCSHCGRRADRRHRMEGHILGSVRFGSGVVGLLHAIQRVVARREPLG